MAIKGGGAIVKYIIDRIEEDFAVCENQETGEMEDIDIFLIPADATEGDVLTYDEDMDEYYLQKEETEELEEVVEDRIDDLWEE